jgi:hypothetical protein
MNVVPEQGIHGGVGGEAVVQSAASTFCFFAAAVWLYLKTRKQARARKPPCKYLPFDPFADSEVMNDQYFKELYFYTREDVRRIAVALCLPPIVRTSGNATAPRDHAVLYLLHRYDINVAARATVISPRDQLHEACPVFWSASGMPCPPSPRCFGKHFTVTPPL